MALTRCRYTQALLVKETPDMLLDFGGTICFGLDEFLHIVNLDYDHRKGEIIKVTALVFPGYDEACLQCLLRRPGPLSWQPLRFSVRINSNCK